MHMLERAMAASALSLLALAGAAMAAGDRASGIAGLFACLEAKSAAIVSAHRGGPAPGFPENALETFARNRAEGVRLFETDIAQSADGVLFLMHDATLDRTTTGEGRIAETTWREIAALRLEDDDGLVTAFTPPRLADALAWAVDAKAFLALDFKGDVAIDEVMAEVEAAGAARHVMYIVGNAARGRAILARDPEALLSVPAGDLDPEALKAGGLPPHNVVLWTGIRDLDAARIAAFDAAGFYVNFGTLGFGDSHDDRIAASGDDSAYAALAAAGLHVISTDRPLAARSALVAAGMAWDTAPVCAP